MQLRVARKSTRRPGVAAIAVLAATIGLSGASTDLRLVEAVKSRNTEAIRSLLRGGVDVNAPQPDGHTVVHWIPQTDEQRPANLLIRAGANLNATNELGATPLW